MNAIYAQRYFNILNLYTIETIIIVLVLDICTEPKDIDIETDVVTVSIRNILGSGGVQPTEHPSHALLGSNSSFVLPDGTTRASYRVVIDAVDTPTITEVQMKLVFVSKVEVTVFATDEELEPVVTEVCFNDIILLHIIELSAYRYGVKDQVFS